VKPLRFARTLVFFLFLTAPNFSDAREKLSIGIEGGYGGNLFADSFQVGSNYLANRISFSSVNFQKIKLGLQYDLSYTNYNTDNYINNFIHLAGISIYNRDRGRKLKWGITGLGIFKDYIDKNSGFDNYRIFGVADGSYYCKSFLQVKAIYRFIRSEYYNFGSLDNIEHWVESEFLATLPTRSTVRTAIRYAVRRFDEEYITFHWYDTELGFSQSLDSRTGLGAKYIHRWSNGGTRPLSSYNVISGITSFWDPWKGNQLEAFIKRVLPLGILTRLETSYWNRLFIYDEILREQLDWLDGKYGRRDEGWATKLEISRQQNLPWKIARSIKMGVSTAYLSNGSDDSYYDYTNFTIQTMFELQVF